MNKVASKLAQQAGTTGAVNAKLAKPTKAAPKLGLEEPSRAKRPGPQTPNKTGGLRLPTKQGENLLSPA